MNSFSVAGLDFQLVKAGSVFIGEDKGGWIYASQRPKHEVKCPDFYIMAKPLTLEELSNLLNTELSPGDETTWNQERLSAIISMLNQTLSESSSKLDSDCEWEIRCPTQSEWINAKNCGKIELTCGMKDILADAVSSNYRGAMMDGRPRKFEGMARCSGTQQPWKYIQKTQQSLPCPVPLWTAITLDYPSVWL